jgi:hypothetical protein
MDLIEYGEMRKPPSSPRPPEIPDEFRRKEKKPETGEEQEGGNGTLPGEVVGAPA